MEKILKVRKEKTLEEMSFNEIKEYVATLEKCIFDIPKIETALEFLDEVKKIIDTGM